MPVCTTPEERVFFQQFILDRIAVLRPGQSYHYAAPTPQEAGLVMLECIERLGKEGNGDLFGELYRETRAENERLAKENEALATELEILKRSRALKLARKVRKLLGISWR